jgi:peptidylprolyl isomerase
MVKIKDEDRVKVNYILALDNGIVIENAEEHELLEFTIGTGKTLPGSEQLVVGMYPEESKPVKRTPEEAYILHNKELIYNGDKQERTAERYGNRIARDSSGRSF